MKIKKELAGSEINFWIGIVLLNLTAFMAGWDFCTKRKFFAVLMLCSSVLTSMALKWNRESHANLKIAQALESCGVREIESHDESKFS